jgi:hypothetical protein
VFNPQYGRFDGQLSNVLQGEFAGVNGGNLY